MEKENKADLCFLSSQFQGLFLCNMDCAVTQNASASESKQIYNKI